MLHISYQYMTIYHQNPCPISGFEFGVKPKNLPPPTPPFQIICILNCGLLDLYTDGPNKVLGQFTLFIGK